MTYMYGKEAHDAMVIDWMPISTAPQTGEFVLVCDMDMPDDIFVLCVSVAFWKCGEWFDLVPFDDGDLCSVDPTHWYPIVKPKDSQ